MSSHILRIDTSISSFEEQFNTRVLSGEFDTDDDEVLKYHPDANVRIAAMNRLIDQAQVWKDDDEDY
jgi:hypothetical protein